MYPVFDQEIPDGFEVTNPVPSPSRITVSGKMPLPKVAETFFGPSMINVHVVEVPEHEPPQPANEYPALGVAVSFTTDPVE